MGRWEPDAAGRLRAAAMDLFVERGYDQTTVADIAARAGVTARTFFRHFADKREVLFAGSAQLQERMLEAVAAAPPGTPPLEAVAAALEVSAEMLGDRREFSRRRQEVIAAHDELRERELVKLDAIGAAVAAALRGRGVPEPEASLTADTGLVVFRQGFARWAFAPEDRPLLEVMTELLGQLRTITA